MSATDRCYFEFADRTLFLGSGHGSGFSAKTHLFDAEQEFETTGADNQNSFQGLIFAHIRGSAW
ncbi:MAG: hypothetical protein N3A53_04075 [Verrucomicrobiae bacterium]|nr:hypothetical protein [Verrucomicrobiae bacterium]